MSGALFVDALARYGIPSCPARRHPVVHHRSRQVARQHGRFGQIKVQVVRTLIRSNPYPGLYVFPIIDLFYNITFMLIVDR